MKNALRNKVIDAAQAAEYAAQWKAQERELIRQAKLIGKTIVATTDPDFDTAAYIDSVKAELAKANAAATDEAPNAVDSDPETETAPAES